MIDKRDTQGRREGAVVGPYVLHEEIGRGGMGVVYRATKADTGLEVAVKLMLPELASNIRFRERFIAEAQTAPKLDHPNIVPVHEAGGVDSELYIAMRLVHGPDLKQVVDSEGRLAPGRVAAILRQVSAALDYAHGVGVVHRDVKPQNILLSKVDDGAEDLVYITDFGLVKPAGSESTASRTSEVLGSIQYMAPEQIEGMPTDGRADVYSLGCVAFEALTGAIPFDRPNEVAVLWAHVHEDPPRVSDLRPDLGGLDIVLATALAKHPDDRYLTCGEFTEAVEQGLASNRRPISMPLVRPLVERVPRKKTEREVWAPNFFPELSRVRRLTNRPNWGRNLGIAGLLAVLLTGSIELAHPQGLVGAAGDVADAADSVVAAVTNPGGESDQDDNEFGNERGDRRRSRTNGRGLLPGGRPPSARGSGEVDQPPLAEAPKLTDDSVPGAQIVFVSGRGSESEIYKTDLDGGGVTRLTRNDRAEFYPTWSPNGKSIAFSSYTEGGATKIWVMREDGSRARPVLSLGPPPTGSIGSADLSWSPDAKRLVYSFGGIYVVNLDGTGKKQLVGAEGTAPDWSPDGRQIVYSKGDPLWIMASDGSGQRQLTNPTDPTPSDFDPTWMPDGDRIAFTRGGVGVFAGDTSVRNSGIFVIDSDGRNLSRVSDGRGEEQPSPGPFGDQFVFMAPAGGYGTGDLYLIDADGSDRRRLTTNGDNAYPDWRWPPS